MTADLILQLVCTQPLGEIDDLLHPTQPHKWSTETEGDLAHLKKRVVPSFLLHQSVWGLPRELVQLCAAELHLGGGAARGALAGRGMHWRQQRGPAPSLRPAPDPVLMPGGRIRGLAPHCPLPGEHRLREEKAGTEARGQKKDQRPEMVLPAMLVRLPWAAQRKAR